MFAPTNASAVLNDLLSEELSLLDVAAQHNTTVAELSAWLELPAIAEKWAAVTTIAAKRARALATIALNSAARALHEIVNDLENPKLNLSYNPANPKDAERRRRQFDLVRRAAWLLYLISRTTGEPPRPRPSRTDPPSDAASTSPASGARTFVFKGAATSTSSAPSSSHATDVAPATSVAPAAVSSPTASAPHATNEHTSSPHEPEARARASPGSAQCDSYEPRAGARGSHAERTEAPTNAQISSYEPDARPRSSPAPAPSDNSAHPLTSNHAAPLRPP